MRIETSIGQFFKDLEEAKDEFTKGALQFQLKLAQMIQHQVQDNIKKTFGKENGPKSEITNRAYGNTARRSGRGGGLFGSVVIERTGNGALEVVAGGVGVPYAAIHESGGVIRPKIAAFLTIPYNPKYAGTRAREHDLVLANDNDLGKVLVKRGAIDSNGLFNKSEVAFLLRRKATIPARPYFAPAVDTVAKDKSVRDGFERYYKDAKFEVEVR